MQRVDSIMALEGGLERVSVVSALTEEGSLSWARRLSISSRESSTSSADYTRVKLVAE